jgi:hypothetical protein
VALCCAQHKATYVALEIMLRSCARVRNHAVVRRCYAT